MGMQLVKAKRQCHMTVMMAATFLTLQVHASETNAAPHPVPPPQEEAQSPTPSLTSMLRSLANFLSQEDVNLLFEYLRDTAIASLTKQEEEVVMPPDLAFKMEVLKRRVEIEGNHYVKTVVMPELMRIAPSLFEAPPPAATVATPVTPTGK